jgi:hypothetical protein
MFPTEPKILSANVYHWKPRKSARGRAEQETRAAAQAATYFKLLGFECIDVGRGSVCATAPGWEVTFHYSESASYCSKQVSVIRNGERSNLGTLRRYAAALRGLADAAS